MKGNRGNYLVQSQFPFLSMLWFFFYHMVNWVYLVLLSSAHLFVSFPNNINSCCQKMQRAYEMFTGINNFISKSD